MKIYISKKKFSTLQKGRNIKKTISYLLEKRPRTYYDIHRKNKQCNRNKDRSFSELFWITKTIHPSLSWKKYALIIKNIVVLKNTFKIIYCPHVGKAVIYKGFSYPGNKELENLLYNYDKLFGTRFYDKKNGKYCVNDILELMGYSEKEITKYRRKHKIKKPRNRYKNYCIK